MRRTGQIGRIAVGAQADLAVLDLHAPAFTPFNDLRGQLVYCESGGSVRATIVAGAVVAEDGRVVSVDEAALLAEARELHGARRRHSNGRGPRPTHSCRRSTPSCDAPPGPTSA